MRWNNGMETDGSMNKRRVDLSMNEGERDRDHIYRWKQDRETPRSIDQRQRDRRVRSGEEGGRLADDGDIRFTSSHGNKSVQRQRDRQVRSGVEGGHLDDDGDVRFTSSQSVMETSPHNGNETGGSIEEWKVAIWPMMEMETSVQTAYGRRLIEHYINYEVDYLLSAQYPA
jgi:hypothetical protein